MALMILGDSVGNGVDAPLASSPPGVLVATNEFTVQDHTEQYNIPLGET